MIAQTLFCIALAILAVLGLQVFFAILVKRERLNGYFPFVFLLAEVIVAAFLVIVCEKLIG